MNTIYFLLKCWWQCARSVFVTRINHKSAQSATGLKKCKQSQPPLLRPFSLPHIIPLYPCLSLLHCHLSYNLKGSQMPSHPPSHQVGAWKLLVTEVSPQPMKSESEKGPRGFKKTKTITKTKTNKNRQCCPAGSELSCDQSPSVNARQGDNTVGHSGVCILWHNAECHLLFGSYSLCLVWFSSALDPSEKHTCISLHSLCYDVLEVNDPQKTNNNKDTSANTLVKVVDGWWYDGSQQYFHLFLIF